MLDDAVATQDTVTQLIAAIRRVAPGGARRRRGDRRALHRPTTTTTRVSRRSPGTTRRPARELVDALVGDAHRLLGHLPEQELGPEGRRGGGVAGAGRRAGRRTGRGLRRHRRAVADRATGRPGPGDLAPSTREARHAHKTVHRRQDGFKAHLAIEPDTGIITDCALTKASGTGDDGAPVSEASVGLDLLAGEDEPVTVLADSAYGSGRVPRRTRRARPHRR